MEKIINLIRENEQFKRYVELIQKYNELPYSNRYQYQESYKTDPVLALLECLEIRQSDGELVVSIDNGIGTLEDYAEVLGIAVYKAVFTRDGDNLNYNGTIDARFTSYNNSMFGVSKSNKSYDESTVHMYVPLLQETVEHTYENMGYLLPAKVKRR